MYVYIIEETISMKLAVDIMPLSMIRYDSGQAKANRKTDEIVKTVSSII